MISANLMPGALFDGVTAGAAGAAETSVGEVLTAWAAAVGAAAGAGLAGAAHCVIIGTATSIRTMRATQDRLRLPFIEQTSSTAKDGVLHDRAWQKDQGSGSTFAVSACSSLRT